MTLSTEQRALVDLHHAIARETDAAYDDEVLVLIASEMGQVRAAPTAAEALQVIAWWDCWEPEEFVSKARSATLRVQCESADGQGGIR